MNLLKNLTLKIICFSLAIISPTFSYSFQNKEIPKDCSVTLSLPVNAALPKGERISLAVNMPKGYKCLQDNLNEVMLEFIPKKDVSPHRWSEIITTFRFIGNKLDANLFVQQMIQNFKMNSTVDKVFNFASENLKTYKNSSITISYKMNDRKEIIYMKYYSGPYDCAGFQYAIALTGQMTEKAALEKIKKFEQENIFIVRF